MRQLLSCLKSPRPSLSASFWLQAVRRTFGRPAEYPRVHLCCRTALLSPHWHAAASPSPQADIPRWSQAFRSQVRSHTNHTTRCSFFLALGGHNALKDLADGWGDRFVVRPKYGPQLSRLPPALMRSKIDGMDWRASASGLIVTIVSLRLRLQMSDKSGLTGC